MTGDHRRWANEPGVPGIIRVFDPYKYRSPLYAEGDTDQQFSDKCLAQIEEVLMYEGPHTVAGFILETVTGTNGIIIPPDGYLKGVRDLCTKHGIMLICDEVMAGLGRTGEWFACDNWKVVPDLLCMAKGVTSAYMPLGVVAINERIAKHFEQNVFFGGLTYSGHPMSLAAGVANLRVSSHIFCVVLCCVFKRTLPQVLKEDDLVGNSKRMGKVKKFVVLDEIGKRVFDDQASGFGCPFEAHEGQASLCW